MSVVSEPHPRRWALVLCGSHTLLLVKEQLRDASPEVAEEVGTTATDALVSEDAHEVNELGKAKIC